LHGNAMQGPEQHGLAMGGRTPQANPEDTGACGTAIQSLVAVKQSPKRTFSRPGTHQLIFEIANP
jgi:hypothetical protein